MGVTEGRAGFRSGQKCVPERGAGDKAGWRDVIELRADDTTGRGK